MKRYATRIAVAGIVIVLALAYGIRVWHINEADKANTTPVEHYAVGEWVDLTGSFLQTEAQAPDGYSIRISKVELLTPDEYVRAYGAEGEDIVGEDSQRTVICLEYQIQHEGAGEVGLVLFEQRLIAGSKNVALKYDNELWWKAEPEMTDQPGMFALRPDSSYTAHIPFSFIRDPDAFQSYEDSPRTAIVDSTFELLVSNLPTRKVIDITL